MRKGWEMSALSKSDVGWWQSLLIGAFVKEEWRMDVPTILNALFSTKILRKIIVDI